MLPALVRRFHEAKTANAPEVVVWGSGKVRREFRHVDDRAEACVFLMNALESEDLINVGVGQDVTIAEAAALAKEVVGYRGELVFDDTKPDGAPRKLLDTSRLASAGWRPKIPLRDGLKDLYAWFLEHHADEGSANTPEPDAIETATDG